MSRQASVLRLIQRAYDEASEHDTDVAWEIWSRVSIRAFDDVKPQWRTGVISVNGFGGGDRTRVTH